MSIKNVSSPLIGAALAYAGSGDALYVPQVDYLNNTRGTSGRDWDVGPDSWYTSGGGGGAWASGSMWC